MTNERMIKVTGKGNYTGTLSGSFAIEPRPITDFALTLKPSSFTYDGGKKEPTVTVKDGCAFVSESDCPGQDCVRMDKISGTGQMIVCLPHHLTVVIEGAGEGPDAVIK